MRWSLAGVMLLLLAFPQAHASFTATIEAPGTPIPVDGTRTVRLILQASCTDLAPYANPDGEVLVDVAWSATGLTFEGPQTLAFTLANCATDPLGTREVVQEFTVNGSRDLPGLVAIPTSVAATFHDAPFNAVVPLPTAAAASNVTPNAIVDYEVVAKDVLPSSSHGEVQIPIEVVTRSNVALAFSWSTAAMESTRGGDVDAVPWGNFTPPLEGWLVEPGLSTAPLTATTTAHYRPPGDGNGVDRYTIAVDPEVVLDPAWPTPSSTLEVAISYSHRDGEVVVGIDQTAHNPRSTGSADTPLPALLALAALATAMALRRRH